MSIRTWPSFAAVAGIAVLATLCLAGLPSLARAQSDEPIYTDSLIDGFQNWSWASVNLANTSPVHSGKNSIAVTAGAWQALYLSSANRPYHAGLYSAISFSIHGGTQGGQKLQVRALRSGQALPPIAIGPLAANTWTKVSLTLAQLGLTGSTTFDGFWLQDATGGKQPTFYVDDVRLTGIAAPNPAMLSVNAAQTVRSVDARSFGMNLGIWDNALKGADYPVWLGDLGTQYLRYPGGSLSDEYDWSGNQSGGYFWYNSQADFTRLVTAAHIPNQVITADYGSGSAQMAAAWVAYCNAAPTSAQSIGQGLAWDPNAKAWVTRDWKTAGYWAALRAASPLGTDDGLNFLRLSHPAPLGVKYWEIGNEVYGGWETDHRTRPHDAANYAAETKNYLSLMKRVDPTIKVGVVITTDEDSYANYSDESVINPVTKLAHTGWAAVLLENLNTLGALPDFVSVHQYNQNPGGESDGYLLQSGSWAAQAASTRLMLDDYLGASATTVEIQCTEHNSVSSAPGKQITSLVNGLFLLDSFGQILQTEFNSLCWWDFAIDSGSSGNNNSSVLYGWRNYGAYGLGRTATDRYPSYYAWKLLAKFVRPGDTLVNASTSFAPLSIYAARRADGTLALLMVNKRNNTQAGAISVAGFKPKPNAVVLSYGKAQDINAQNGGTGSSVDIQQSSLTGIGTTFRYTFPAYTAVMIVLSPGP